MAAKRRNVLVYSPLPHCAEQLCDAVRRQRWVSAELNGRTCIWAGRGLSFKVSGGNVLTLSPPLTITGEEH